jgi:hypothetical protein
MKPFSPLNQTPCGAHPAGVRERGGTATCNRLRHWHETGPNSRHGGSPVARRRVAGRSDVNMSSWFGVGVVYSMFAGRRETIAATLSGWSMKGLRLPWRVKIAALRCRSHSDTGS